jgi:hypothetical protein
MQIDDEKNSPLKFLFIYTFEFDKFKKSVKNGIVCK